MEIIKNFGVDPLLISAQIVNFLLLVYLLQRFFLKKIIKFLEERQNKIKEGLASALRGEELLEKAKASQKEILSQARAQAKIILQNAQRDGLELAKKIEEKTLKEADRIIEEARNKTQEEVVKVQKELSRETSRIAIALVEKVLREFLTVQDQKKIITHLSKNIKVSS